MTRQWSNIFKILKEKPANLDFYTQQRRLLKRQTKETKDRGPSWGGSHKGGEVSKHQETLSPVGLWGVLEFQRGT